MNNPGQQATGSGERCHAESWRDRTVLVTGATGLVGGWLCRRLLDLQADVVCLVRDWVPQCDLVRSHAIDSLRVVRGNVCNQRLLERVLGEYEIDSVFHLAAQTIVGVANRNPLSTFETNIGGTWRLLEACRRSPTVKAIVVASSDKAYGDQFELPYKEETPLQGRHPYDVSKSCADLIAQSYAKTYDLPVAIARCGNFYGGGDLNWSRVVPGTIRAALRNRRPVIRSDGSPVRDYFYVEDGAAAYLLLAERLRQRGELRGEAFNFSTEEQFNVLELTHLVLDTLGSDVQPEIRGEATNEIRRQGLSAAKAREVLDWKPDFSLRSGLDRTIAWYRSYLGEAA